MMSYILMLVCAGLGHAPFEAPDLSTFLPCLQIIQYRHLKGLRVQAIMHLSH